MAKHGKKYQAALEKVEADKFYTPMEAAKLAKEISTANFDESVEAHFRLNVDTRQADQQVRGSISLPNGTGKTVRVAVFAEGDKAKEAEEAGADVVGSDDLVADIQAGNINFDAAIATPDMMSKVGRLGKILGPRGMMPSPKLGTVTPDVAKAVKEVKGGKVEYRADRYGICHVTIGKVSFEATALAENYGALYDEILRVKPSSVKGRYVKSVTFSTTMGPGIPVATDITREYTAEYVLLAIKPKLFYHHCARLMTGALISKLTRYRRQPVPHIRGSKESYSARRGGRA